MILRMLMCAPLLCWYHAASLCLPLSPKNCCLLWRSFVLSVSIAAFFSLSSLKTCSFSIWKWDFSEVKTCLGVNPSRGTTLKCPLLEGDCLSGPTLYHLLVLSLCQVSAEQIKVRTFQPKNGKALSCPSKQFAWKPLLPYPKGANPHQKLVQRRQKQLKIFLLSDRMMKTSKNEKSCAALRLAETTSRTFN